MIISVDGEKAFYRIQHPFMVKMLNKADLDGTSLYDKGHMWQIRSDYHTQW